MTSGIYLLRFNGTDKVYVGQSRRIEERFTKHKYRLSNNQASIKLQEAYNTYGMPSIEIVLEAEHDLDLLEDEAIEIYDSVKNGFNIRTAARAGEGLQGVLHPNSKYSTDQIMHVAMLLTDVDTSFSEIEALTKVDISTIRDISKGKAHKWLKNQVPEVYTSIVNLKGSRPHGNTLKDKLKDNVVLCHKEYGEVVVDNISEFSRVHGLNKSHVSGVISGKRKTHKGWYKK